MAVVSQTLMVLETLLENDGSLAEIADRIHNRYGDSFNAQMLTHGDDYTFIKMRLRELPCVEETDGIYHFNPDATKYGRDHIIEACVKFALQTRSEKMRERLAQPDCENTKIEL